MPVRPDSARRPLRRVAGPNAETRIWGREAGVGRCGGGAVVLNTIAHSYARLDPPSVRGPGATPRLVREGVQGWWAERDGTGQRAAAARRSSSVSQHPAGSAARRPCLRLPMSLRRHEIHRIVLEEKRQPGN
jgi:hypothetical protein